MAPRKCGTQPFTSAPDLLVNYVSNFGLLISAVTVLAATVWGKVLGVAGNGLPSSLDS